jgi:hypothetical protein
VGVELGPAFIGVERLVERVDVAVLVSRGDHQCRRDDDEPRDALGVVRGEEERALCSE